MAGGRFACGGRLGRARRFRCLAGAVAGAVAAAGLILIPGSALGVAVLTVCSHGCPYTQIQPAVDAAAAGDAVAVGPGRYAGGIVIAKALTLSGAGAGSTVISGGGPVITVSAAPVIIRALTVTGGHLQGDGGGILNTGALTVADTIISHNTADFYGGGLANEGGCGIDLTASLTLRDDLIAGNVSGLDGGGIYNICTANAVIRGTVIRGNTALDGGGIESDIGATMSLRFDAIRRNSSLNYGGGIGLLGGSATIADTTISGNTTGDSGAGGILAGGNLSISDSTINHNDTSGPGGGVYVLLSSGEPGTVVTISGTSVNGNKAATGGGVHAEGGFGAVNIVNLVNDVVSRNQASAEGGGIGISNVGPGIRLTMDDTSVTRNTSGGDGGGIINLGTVNLTNDAVNANTAAGKGGGIFNGDQAVLTLDGATAVNRNDATAGGGIYDDAGTASTDGATVRGNIPDNCEPTACH